MDNVKIMNYFETAGSVSSSQLTGILFLFDCVYCWHSSSMVAPGNNDTQDWLTGSISMSVQKLQPQCLCLVMIHFTFIFISLSPQPQKFNKYPPQTTTYPVDRES